MVEVRRATSAAASDLGIFLADFSRKELASSGTQERQLRLGYQHRYFFVFVSAARSTQISSLSFRPKNFLSA